MTSRKRSPIRRPRPWRRPAAAAAPSSAAAPPVRLPIGTSLGIFTATFTSRGLARLDFPGPGPVRPTPEASRAQVTAWARQTAAALEQVLEGKPAAALPPFDLENATAFQVSVWQSLLAIPPGESRTYAQIAAGVGRPRAARAVGQACGANPIPVLIPCHRVLAAGGSLGGFSAGRAWKRRLLAREGQTVRGDR